jgi:hypothetical protein
MFGRGPISRQKWLQKRCGEFRLTRIAIGLVLAVLSLRRGVIVAIWRVLRGGLTEAALVVALRGTVVLLIASLRRPIVLLISSILLLRRRSSIWRLG